MDQNNPFPSKYNNLFLISGIWVIVYSCFGCCVTCKTNFSGIYNIIYFSTFCILSLVGSSLFMVITVLLMVALHMIGPGIYKDFYDWFIVFITALVPCNCCIPSSECEYENIKCDTPENMLSSCAEAITNKFSKKYYLNIVVYAFIGIFVIQVYSLIIRY